MFILNVKELNILEHTEPWSNQINSEIDCKKYLNKNYYKIGELHE